jgi:hypothetical protein
LNDTFRKLNYPAVWKVGERRDLPEEVLKRVISSGGQITFADPNARESKLVEGAAPAVIDAEALYIQQYKKGKKVRAFFPEGFRDGNLTAEFAAIGHPAEIGVGELVDLPRELLERITASGGLVSTNPEEIKRAESNQAKFALRNKEWREQDLASKANNEKYKLIGEHNKAAMAEIETLSREFITATGAEREALWQKIRELKTSLS